MLKIYFDASTKGNPGPSGGGFVVIGEQLYEQHSFALTGELSNHQAEFAVFSEVLTYLTEQNYVDQLITIYTDSKLVAESFKKNYTKHPDFQDYLAEVQFKAQLFPLLFLEWIPEAKNKGADNLARQGLTKALKLQNRR